MQKTQTGDRVLVHYVKRFDDGSEVSSRSRDGEPLEITIGSPHRRFPGLGGKLVGLAPGQEITIAVPSEVAFGRSDPGRVRRLARSRFPGGRVPPVGKRVRVADRNGRSRSVRVVAVQGGVVVVDANHCRVGQGLELSVELVAILASGPQPVTS